MQLQALWDLIGRPWFARQCILQECQPRVNFETSRFDCLSMHWRQNNHLFSYRLPTIDFAAKYNSLVDGPYPVKIRSNDRSNMMVLVMK